MLTRAASTGGTPDARRPGGRTAAGPAPRGGCAHARERGNRGPGGPVDKRPTVRRRSADTRTASSGGARRPKR
eukprot:820440-Lingulodinium_polyedra.AAC.1